LLKKSSFYRFLKVIQVLLAFSLVGVISAYYFEKDTLGPFSILQLFTPILLVFQVVFLLFWGFKKRWGWSLLFLSVLLITLVVFGSFYKLRLKSGPQGDFTIMSYNAMGFNRYGWIKVPKAGDKISEFIKTEAPDILCLQEHSRIRYKELTQYPYKMETAYSVPRSIQAIFSKYPIVSQGELNPPNTINNIIYADIVVKGDTIRIYNVHLQSYKVVPAEASLSNTKPKKLYGRIMATFSKQIEQAKLLKRHISKSPYKVMVCGDFNNTQFSNVYGIIAQGMNDSFLKTGKGMGATYRFKGLPMRIDYILAENSVKIVGHRNFKIKYSDHYPVMAEVELKE